MTQIEAFNDFIIRFKHLIIKNPHLIKTTLSNIFTMRLIGNKTHGDLAEIGIPEFINQFMYDFSSKHVGKELYRSKEHEEDIKITNEIQSIDFSISLKAYGNGPLQLSTDKNSIMFPFLKSFKRDIINSKNDIKAIFSSNEFSEFNKISVLPLIYNEKEKLCNIMIFDFAKAKNATAAIKLETEGKGRKHPVFRFFDSKENYICEVRYGNAAANALQRGLWTDTKKADIYFNSITNGWINYSDNKILVTLFSHALISTAKGHNKALKSLIDDIEEQKTNITE